MFLVGLMFAVAGIAFCVAGLGSIQSGTFNYNGRDVAPGDFQATATLIAMTMVFFLVGAGMCAYATLARVVVSDRRITIRNFLNGKVFDSPWDQVTGYRRVPGKWSNIGTQWQIQSATQVANLPSYSDEANMQLAMIDHLPRTSIQAECRPSTIMGAPRVPVHGAVRSGTDAFAAVFSILWYGAIAAIAMVVATKMATPTKADGQMSFLPWFVLVCFAIIPASAFAEAWRRLFNGSIQVDDDGIRYTSGKVTFGTPWANLRFLDVRTVTYRNNSTSDTGGSSTAYRTIEQIVLISGESGILLDSNLPQFSDVKRFALAYAPATAYVFAND